MATLINWKCGYCHAENEDYVHASGGIQPLEPLCGSCDKIGTWHDCTCGNVYACDQQGCKIPTTHVCLSCDPTQVESGGHSARGSNRA